MKKITLVVMAVLFISLSVYGNEPTFNINGGNTPFAEYYGTVKSCYVNNHDEIILYFDTAISEDNLTLAQSSYSENLTQRYAALFQISTNPDFAKYLYATMLTAQTTGKKIHIQMRGVSTGVHSGYPLIDRIWLQD